MIHTPAQKLPTGLSLAGSRQHVICSLALPSCHSLLQQLMGWIRALVQSMRTGNSKGLGEGHFQTLPGEATAMNLGPPCYYWLPNNLTVGITVVFRSSLSCCCIGSTVVSLSLALSLGCALDCWALILAPPLSCGASGLTLAGSFHVVCPLKCRNNE